MSGYVINPADPQQGSGGGSGQRPRQGNVDLSGSAHRGVRTRPGVSPAPQTEAPVQLPSYSDADGGNAMPPLRFGQPPQRPVGPNFPPPPLVRTQSAPPASIPDAQEPKFFVPEKHNYQLQYPPPYQVPAVSMFPSVPGSGAVSSGTKILIVDPSTGAVVNPGSGDQGASMTRSPAGRSGTKLLASAPVFVPSAPVSRTTPTRERKPGGVPPDVMAVKEKEDQARRAQEVKRREEEAAKEKAGREEEARRQAEEEARRQAEEEEARRKAEEEARRQAEEEEARRKAEEEARRQAEEEEARRKAQEEARLKAEEEEARRRREEEESRIRREAAEMEQKRAEEAAREKEEEAQRAAEEMEQARRVQEELEAASFGRAQVSDSQGSETEVLHAVERGGAGEEAVQVSAEAVGVVDSSLPLAALEETSAERVATTLELEKSTYDAASSEAGGPEVTPASPTEQSVVGPSVVAVEPKRVKRSFGSDEEEEEEEQRPRRRAVRAPVLGAYVGKPSPIVVPGAGEDVGSTAREQSADRDLKEARATEALNLESPRLAAGEKRVYTRDELMELKPKHMDKPPQELAHVEALMSSAPSRSVGPQRGVGGNVRARTGGFGGLSPQMSHPSMPVHGKAMAHAMRRTQSLKAAGRKASKQTLTTPAMLEKAGLTLASDGQRWVPPSHAKEKQEELDVALRGFQAVLNKMTVETFDKLSEKLISQVKSKEKLTGFIDLIFEKALQEPHFSEMYAELCVRLSQKIPTFEDDDDPTKLVTFKRLLLNKCQAEFEKIGLGENRDILVRLRNPPPTPMASDDEDELFDGRNLELAVTKFSSSGAQANDKAEQSPKPDGAESEVKTSGDAHATEDVDGAGGSAAGDAALEKADVDTADAAGRASPMEEPRVPRPKSRRREKTPEEIELSARRKQLALEEFEAKLRRKMLGNIRFIGELFKQQLLTEYVIHQCLRELLNNVEDPVWEEVEALCRLMTTVGKQIDHEEAKRFVDGYMERIKLLYRVPGLPSRIRFMLMDVEELRENQWVPRRSTASGKKLADIRADAEKDLQDRARKDRLPLPVRQRSGPPIMHAHAAQGRALPRDESSLRMNQIVAKHKGQQRGGDDREDGWKGHSRGKARVEQDSVSLRPQFRFPANEQRK